MRFASRRGRKT